MSRIAFFVAGVVAMLALAAPLGATSNAGTLTGTVGPGFTITLKKGKYTYVCDPHATAMHHSFKVT